jgi:hypothetical protein
VIGRAGRVEVAQLGGHVAAAVAPLDLGSGSEPGLVSGPGVIAAFGGGLAAPKAL